MPNMVESRDMFWSTRTRMLQCYSKFSAECAVVGGHEASVCVGWLCKPPLVRQSRLLATRSPQGTWWFTVAFASGYAFEHIQRRFIKEELADAQTFAKFLRHHPDLAVVYGNYLEGIAHIELSGDSKGQCSFHPLSATIRLKRDITGHSVAKMHGEMVSYHRDLDDVVPYVYYHPYSKIYRLG
jgi:hypothetical protein